MRNSDPKDSKKRFFRTEDRILNLNGDWYFATRDGDVGPYRSRTRAEAEVIRFINDRLQLQHFQETRSEVSSGVADLALQRRRMQMSALDAQVERGNMALSLDDDLLI